MKASVVIPAYNEEDYIGKCLETLLSQSYGNFEVIIVDDGSKDRTVDIVSGMMKKHKNLHLLHQQHGGPGRGRNLGSEHSKGEILVFVDADMEFEKDYISNLVKPVVEGKAIGTFHIIEGVANKGNIWARCWGTKRVDIKPGETRPIFRAVLKKEFMAVGGFDPAKGTFDDQSLAGKLGKEAVGVEAICYHNNPTTLSETFHHMKWIGGSFVTNSEAVFRHTKRFLFFIIPSLAVFAILAVLLLRHNWRYLLAFIIASPVLLAMLLTLRRIVQSRDFRLIFALPVFYLAEIVGFVAGMLKQIPNAIVSKIKGQKISYKY